MDEITRTALAELNRVFYAEFADNFAATRRGWPLGFERILPYLAPAANVLDVGCGNGRLLAFLAERGWRGRYLGLDNSAGLRAEAAERIARLAASAADVQPADLTRPGWGGTAADFAAESIACLAVLHHIPGAAQRAAFVAECAALLPAGGTLILSTWQFLDSPRLRARVLPWALAGIRTEDVEPGDYLLSWGSAAAGRRYCAAIDAKQLTQMARDAGLAPVELFRADGHEGDLSQYGVFRK